MPVSSTVVYTGWARAGTPLPAVRRPTTATHGTVQVGDVKSVDASWETFRGPVTVRWNIEGDTFRLDAAIPPGMTATVALPAAAGSTLKADGARWLRRESARAVYEIGSGSYRFEAAGFRRLAKNKSREFC